MSEVDLFQLVAQALRQVRGHTEDFVRAESASCSAVVAALVASTGGALEETGFRAVGALTCGRAPRVVIHGYARPGADSWAVLHTDRAGLGWLELFSWFTAQDAALLTSQIGALRDEPRKNRFRSRCHGLEAHAVVEAHERRKHALIERFGPALPVDPSPLGFQFAMAQAVKRQLWC